MKRYYFKLFVTGQSSLSERAIVNLRGICEGELAGDYELIIIDVQENPQEAEEYKILATPTLVRELPRPVRHIIGDLTDTEQVRMGLLAATQV